MRWHPAGQAHPRAARWLTRVGRDALSHGVTPWRISAADPFHTIITTRGVGRPRIRDARDRLAVAHLGVRAAETERRLERRRDLIEPDTDGQLARPESFPRNSNGAAMAAAPVRPTATAHGAGANVAGHQRCAPATPSASGDRPSYVLPVIKARRSAGRAQKGAGVAAAAFDLHEAPAQSARSAAAGIPSSASAIAARRDHDPYPCAPRYPRPVVARRSRRLPTWS